MTLSAAQNVRMAAGQTSYSNQASSSDTTQDPSHDAAVLAFEPYPSPALSAYSYTSSTSTDVSDFESDLDSLSLDPLNNPGRAHAYEQHGLSVDTQNHQQGQEPWARHRLQASDHNLSGTVTPTATSSASFFTSNDSESRTSYSRRSLSPKTTPSGAKTSQSDSASSSFSAQDPEADDEEDQLELDGEGQGFDFQDVNEDDMHAKGLPAARGWRLDARKADTPEFHATVLELLSLQLKLYGWSPETADPAVLPLQPENVKLKRISGAFTNAVFFASYKLDSPPPDAVLPPTVLLRVYGTSSEVLLSRRAELLILHTLSSLYEIGPHILGTFANGRVEEFYDCEPIHKEGMRDFGDRETRIVNGGQLRVRGMEGRAHWVARRMNELHNVPLEVMKTVLEQGDLKGPSEKGFGRGIENHIMACSHRPRRRTKHKSNPTSGAVPPSPHLYGLEGRAAIRASPAPMGPGEAPNGNADGAATPASMRPTPDGDHDFRGFYSDRNSSVASLDSLATSYNSQSSMSSESLMLRSPPSGPWSTSVGSQSSTSYFPPNAGKGSMSPITLGPSHTRTTPGRPSSSSSSSSLRGPYPGVWRRLKRWSVEAAKIVHLVEKFAATESGAKAITAAFADHPSLAEEREAGTLNTDHIGPTPGSLRNLIRAVRAVDLRSLYRELDEFKRFVRKWERKEGPSKRVFAHNDAQYGNLLAIKHFPGSSETINAASTNLQAKSPTTTVVDLEAVESSPSIPTGMPRYAGQRGRSDPASPAPLPQRSLSRSRTRKNPPPHHRLVVIDFEYASPNPRGYDSKFLPPSFSSD